MPRPQPCPEEIILGTAVAGRDHVELEGQIGFYVNTLALRDRLSGGDSFRQILARVKQTCAEAYEHQDYPFDQLMTDLRIDRNPSRSPLFDVSILLHHGEQDGPALDGVRAAEYDTGFRAAKFDLSFDFIARGGELSFTVEFNTDLFAAPRIKRMIGHLRQLALSMVEAPDAPIASMRMLAAFEREELLFQFNPRSVEVPRPGTIMEMFEARAEAAPENVALSFQEETVTYRELSRRANDLALFLRRRGVGRGTFVGVFMERSIEMIVAIVGILKAGAAYVPLDPMLPAHRLAVIIEDCKPACILTHPLTHERMPDSGAVAVCIDGSRETIPAELEGESVMRPEPGDTAYLIYTSGSTGTPKGVMVSHANKVRLFTSTEHWFGFGSEDVWTLFHSHAFDFSVWEIWGALLYGGRLVVVPHRVSRSPEAFHQLLVRERVTVLNQTPSAFLQLIEADLRVANSPQLRLRQVIFGGEALDIAALRPWIERHGDQSPRLVNMFGITETTVHVTCRVIRAADLGSARSVIGCPIPDLQVYLLDSHREPVPLGVAGEIYVGGAGVAQGYLNRPELTAQRFVPDPFRPGPGARLYRSGDLARHLPNGDLEYLGRIDQQVKVRGFRIELGEIETVLRQCPGVRAAAVIAHTDGQATLRLVAYLMADAEPIEHIREHLRGRLPDYMIPALFMRLAALPLNLSGKLDRKALPPPDWTQATSGEPFLAPRNNLERLLAGMWAEFLGVERVGVHDNFFELGGHSLLVTQLVSRLRDMLKLRVSIAEFFGAPTVARLAETISRQEENQEQIEKIDRAALKLATLSDEQKQQLLERKRARQHQTVR